MHSPAPGVLWHQFGSVHGLQVEGTPMAITGANSASWRASAGRTVFRSRVESTGFSAHAATSVAAHTVSVRAKVRIVPPGNEIGGQPGVESRNGPGHVHINAHRERVNSLKVSEGRGPACLSGQPPRRAQCSPPAPHLHQPHPLRLRAQSVRDYAAGSTPRAPAAAAGGSFPRLAGVSSRMTHAASRRSRKRARSASAGAHARGHGRHQAAAGASAAPFHPASRSPLSPSPSRPALESR